MIHIVTYRWGDTFTQEHVDILRSMCERHIHVPFKFTCFEEDAPFNELPRCYKRLWLYSNEASVYFKGDRILLLDLDLVITDDITSIIEANDPFAYYNKNHVEYQGAFQIITPGLKSYIWDEFISNPDRNMKDFGSIGSDQGWLHHKMDKGLKVYTEHDGFYCFDIHIKRKPKLPENCKIVFFRAQYKPWNFRKRRPLWLVEHWR